MSLRAALRARPPTLLFSRAYRPARPSSWFHRLWYRPDGIRRSKVKGLIYVTALTASSILYYGAYMSRKEQQAFVFVAKLQQIDSKHPIDDSSTPSDVVAYIRAVGDIIPLFYPFLSPDDMAHLAEALYNFSEVSPQHGETVRKILRDMHEIYTRGDQQVTEETIHEVVVTFDKLFMEVFTMRETLLGGGNAEGLKGEDEGGSDKNSVSSSSRE